MRSEVGTREGGTVGGGVGAACHTAQHASSTEVSKGPANVRVLIPNLGVSHLGQNAICYRKNQVSLLTV